MNGATIKPLWITMLACLLLVEAAVAADVGASRTVRSTTALRTRRSRAAEQAAEKALREVFRAGNAMNSARSLKQRDFELSPEWQNALGEARQARAEFEHARCEALSQLERESNYKAAKIDIWNSSEALKATRDPKKLAGMSSDLLKKRSALSNMEAAQLAGDDAFRQARDALADAERKLASLRKDLVDAIRTDPQWQQARAQYVAARARLMVNG